MRPRLFADLNEERGEPRFQSLGIPGLKSQEYQEERDCEAATVLPDPGREEPESKDDWNHGKLRG